MSTRTSIRLFSPILCGVLLSIGSSCRTWQADSAPAVTIRNTRWRVALALTQQQRIKGLAGRSSLRNDEGMLFIYPKAQMLEFHMEGCLIPLDIAFIDADRRVIAIHTMTVEPDLRGHKVYRSGRPAQYALEVPAGTLSRARVRPGDRVIFSPSVPDATKAQSGP